MLDDPQFLTVITAMIRFMAILLYFASRSTL